MRTRFLAAVTVGLLAPGLPAQDAGKMDAQSLQGTWKVVSVEFAGRKPLPRTYDGSTVVIARDRITFKTKSGSASEATFKLDAAVKPKAIDLSFISGRHTGKTQSGIYSLEGDTLRLCTTAPGQKRPADFATMPDTDLGLITFERVRE